MQSLTLIRTLYLILIAASITLSTATTYLLIESLLPAVNAIIAVSATITLMLGQYVFTQHLSRPLVFVPVLALFALSITATAIAFEKQLAQQQAQRVLNERQLELEHAQQRQTRLNNNAQVALVDQQIKSTQQQIDHLIRLAERDSQANYRRRATETLSKTAPLRAHIAQLADTRQQLISQLRLNEPVLALNVRRHAPASAPNVPPVVVWVLAALLDVLALLAIKFYPTAHRTPQPASNGALMGRECADAPATAPSAPATAPPSAPPAITNHVNVTVENSPVQTLTLAEKIGKGDYGKHPSQRKIFEAGGVKRQEVRDAFKQCAGTGKIKKIGNKWTLTSD